MRDRRALLFVVMHIAAFSGAVSAQTLDQQRCSAPDPDLSISGCTAMMRANADAIDSLF
jgi:hypothetical protein